MKKYLLSALLLITILLQSYAQKPKSVIYLKNGSILYGKLIEISDNQYKVEGNDGSLLIFPSSEVEKYLMEQPSFEGRKKSGLGFSLEAGFLLGAQSNDYIAPFSFNTVLHYTLESKNIFGLGTGAEFLGKTFTPVFAEFKHVIKDKKVSPFIFARTGMLFYLGSDDEESSDYNPQYYSSKEYRGGPMVTAGTGISWAGEDIETYLSFAYRYARTSYVQSEYNQQDVTYTNNYNRLEIKLGFKF